MESRDSFNGASAQTEQPIYATEQGRNEADLINAKADKVIERRLA